MRFLILPKARLFADYLRRMLPRQPRTFIELAEGTRDWTHPLSRKKSKDRLYDGTIFHRVIPEFMIQGGDPAGTGMGGPGYQFEDETKNSSAQIRQAGQSSPWPMPDRIPMDRSSFITLAPTTWLTGKHTIFGEVVEGQTYRRQDCDSSAKSAGQAEYGCGVEVSHD